MTPPATRVRVCLAHAEDHFRRGSREIGLTLYQEAERLLPEVADPIDFLWLTLRIERMVQSHLLPEHDR